MTDVLKAIDTTVLVEENEWPMSLPDNLQEQDGTLTPFFFVNSVPKQTCSFCSWLGDE